MTVYEAVGERIPTRLFCTSLRLKESRINESRAAGLLDDDLLDRINHPLQEWINRWSRRRGLVAGYIIRWLSPPLDDPLARTEETVANYPEWFELRVKVRWIATTARVTPEDLALVFPVGAPLARLGFRSHPSLEAVA